MDRDNIEIRLLMVIALLIGCLFWSRSCSDSDLKEAEQQHQEEIEELEGKYFKLYDELYGEYMDLYYACEYDPGSSVPLEDFTHPEDLPYPFY